MGANIQIGSGRPGEWMIFATYFWIPFVFSMPVVGQIMALVRVLIYARGSFMGASISSGGSSTSYPPIELTAGESHPAALLFFAYATLWPAMMLPLFDPSLVSSVLGIAPK